MKTFCFILLLSSCTQLRISSNGDLNTFIYEEGLGNWEEFAIEKDVNFYLYGLYPSEYHVHFDEELNEVGYKKVANITYDYKQSLFQIALSYLTLGMYLPHTMTMYGQGVKFQAGDAPVEAI